MIIPIGHEHTTVRRQPWVTFSIMGVCTLAFLMTVVSLRGQAPVEQRLEEFVEYFLDHPYLELATEQENLLKELFAPVGLSRDLEAFIETRKEAQQDVPTDPARLVREKAELDRLFDAAMGRIESDPHFAWGLVPDDLEPHAFITYQFMHGGFWHLFGNLFILFLAGPFIEDVWGRPLYLGFYLLAGVVSALMFVLKYPTLDGPLIGASGAIAGVMGAFLIRYWNSRIKFLYWFFVFFVGTFTAPAWLMLPLWFVKELVFAQAFDVVAPDGGGGGVAYWAHVWGFVFGVVVAVAVRRFGIEERFIHRAIESKITLVDNTVVEQALEAGAAGDVDRAKSLLKDLLVKDAGNVDAAAALWNLCSATGDFREALSPMTRALERAARTGDADSIAANWPLVLESGLEVQVDPAVGLRLVEMLQGAGLADVARRTVDSCLAPLSQEAPLGLVLRLARAAAAVEAASALALIRTALTLPDLPPDARRELEELAEEVRRRGAQQVEELPSRAQLEPAIDLSPIDPGGLEPRELQVAEAVPRALTADALELRIGDSDRRLPLDQIQTMAVAGVRSDHGSKPFVVIDLLLDSPWGERTRLRCVRLRSSRFDPRAVVGGEAPMEALRKLLVRLLEASDAVPLPDPESARGRPFVSYESISAYERQVLGIGG